MDIMDDFLYNDDNRNSSEDANEQSKNNKITVDNREKEEFDKTIDLDVVAYVRDYLDGKEVSKSITVGFIAEREAQEIEKLTGLTVCGNRITMDKDALVHIIKRHGANGLSDHSMQDESDIAKISYILSNYDAIELGEGKSRKYKTILNEPAPHIVLSKKMDGIYYVVEAVTDAKSHTNHIVTMYKRKEK